MHEIRLAGPWEVKTAGSPDWTRTQLPLTSSPDGSSTFRRRFHRPSGLTAETTVRIALSATPNARICLNEQPLEVHTTGDTSQVDVSTVLQEYNELTIDLQAAFGTAAKTIETVALQILEQ